MLVDEAGTIRRSPAAEHRDDDWDTVLEVNLTAQFVLTREIGGRCSSAAGERSCSSPRSSPSRAGSPFPATQPARAASRQLTKAFANEWATRGVNVNAVAPGYIATDNTQALHDDPVRSRQILDRIPAGRWGTAADIAGAVLFLSSPLPTTCTGSCCRWTGDGWRGERSDGLLRHRIVPVVVMSELESRPPDGRGADGRWAARSPR